MGLVRALSFSKRKAKPQAKAEEPTTPSVAATECSQPSEPGNEPSDQPSGAHAVVRRSSSFKRKVTGRKVSQAATESAVGACASVVASGELYSVTRGKATRHFAVCYEGRAGRSLALHKSESDFTAFRAFPEEVSYLPTREVRVNEKRADGAASGPSHFLRVDRSEREPSLLLGFSSHADMEVWTRALQPPDAPAAAAPPVRRPLAPISAAAATAEVTDAMAAMVTERQQTLEESKRRLAAEREAAARLADEMRRVEAEYERLVAKLPHELEG